MMDAPLLTGLREVIKALRSGTLNGPSVTPTPQEVRRIREALGLSQQAFAERLGVSVGTVQSWELGRRRPSRLGQALALVQSAKETV